MLAMSITRDGGEKKAEEETFQGVINCTPRNSSAIFSLNGSHTWGDYSLI